MSQQPPMQIRFATGNRPGTPQQRPNVIQFISRQNSSLLPQRLPLIVKSSNTNTAVQYMKSDEYNSGQMHQQFQQIPPPSFMNQFNATGIPGLSSFSLANSAAALMAQSGNNAGSSGSRKPCNCTKSNCLKLYCECFAQGQLCQNCNCNNCMNNLAHEEERRRAVKMTLERNPAAFNPKIGRGEGERRHTKGCNCKRSGCLKNYCECYEAKISCSDMCRCHSCKNTEDSIERRSLLRLAALGSYKSKHSSSYKKHLQEPSPETLPHSFFTWEIIEALVSCLLAQADDAERRDLPAAVQERLILEEFGRSVDLIIKSAGKALVRTMNTIGMHGDEVPSGGNRFGSIRRNIDDIDEDEDLDEDIPVSGTASGGRKNNRRSDFMRSDDELDDDIEEDLEDEINERDVIRRVTSIGGSGGRQIKQQPIEDEDVEDFKPIQKASSKTTKKSSGSSNRKPRQQPTQIDDPAPTRTSGRKHTPSRKFRNEEYD